MAKTITITLRDTGYRTAAGVGLCSEIAEGDSGTATTLSINCNSIVYNIDIGSNDKAVPNRFENDDQNEIFGLSEVDSIGIGAPTFTIKGVFDIESSTDRLTFAKLVKMTKTQGVKELSGTPSTSSWINYINYYDDYYANQSKSASAVVEHIHVRISNFNVNAPSERNYASWNMTLKETK